MKHLLYVSDSAPNGTQSLYICDQHGQIIGFIDEAVFGLRASPEDAFGNVTAVFYGESIGLIEYSTPANEDAEDEGTLAEAVLSGNYSDLEPVSPVSLEQVLEHLACSPVDPSGEDVLEQLKSLGVTK